MEDLRSCLAGAGYQNVVTYIQSGNAIFSSAASSRASLLTQTEKLLSDRFNYTAAVVLRSQAELRAVVAGAPDEFGDAPDKYRYDVLFPMQGLTASAVLRQISRKEGVDTAHVGSGVVYFRRLTARAAQSHLSKLASQPLYKRLTVRNWNTTVQLLRLMED
jgi:uncharacterized protein (DUF1697 family)